MKATVKHLIPMVMQMAEQGKRVSEISGATGLSAKQISNIKTRSKGIVPTQKPQQKAWVTRRANEKKAAKKIEAVKPKTIYLNGLEIEIHNAMIKRVIISEKNTIKII